MLCSQDAIGAVHIQPLLSNGEPAEIQKEGPKHPKEFETLELKSAYKDRCPICLEPSSIHPACSMKLAGTKSPLRIEVVAEAKESTFRMLPAGSSISGVQDKNLFKIKNGVFKPQNPSSHIIKPEGDYPEMPANEHLTMTIARRLKFKVPPTGLFEVDGLGLVFVIKRFDRIPKEGKVLLEDFAQILAFMEDDKEEGSFEDIASAIERYCNSPIIEKSELFRRLLFCFVFGNGDIHLKNWSLIYESSKKLYKLSPVYDWLNVRASMPEEKVESVLPISGKRSEFTRQDFQRFARDRLKIGNHFIAACFDEVPQWLELARTLCTESALSEKMKTRYIKVVEERAQRILSHD